MITNIRLQNFRSYLDSSFEFESGVNIIVGPNAVGKTNLLEAIYMVAKNKSFKVKDLDVVNFGKDWARLDSYSEDREVIIKLQMENGIVKKQTSIDGNKYVRLPQRFNLPVVLFEPSQLNLLHGGPEIRRTFLDEMVAQYSPEYQTTLRNYKRILSQRNTLLKSGTASSEQFFVWNMRLSELAQEIVLRRVEACQEINKKISQIYSEMAGRDNEVIVKYKTNLNIDNYSSDLLKKLEQNHTTEIQRGFTLFGPHRDDIAVVINGKDAGVSASRGEARTMLLALKSIEIEIIEKNTDHHVMLLLDDVFSELDGLRRKSITAYMSNRQTFITTTDADILIYKLVRRTNVIALGKD